MLNSNERTYKEIDLKRRYVVSKIAVIVIVYLAGLVSCLLHLW